MNIEHIYLRLQSSINGKLFEVTAVDGTTTIRYLIQLTDDEKQAVKDLVDSFGLDFIVEEEEGF